jgi:hypothetical protein
MLYSFHKFTCYEDIIIIVANFKMHLENVTFVVVIFVVFQFLKMFIIKLVVL